VLKSIIPVLVLDFEEDKTKKQEQKKKNRKRNRDCEKKELSRAQPNSTQINRKQNKEKKRTKEY